MNIRPYGHVGVLVEAPSGADVQRLCAAVDASSLQAVARPGWRSVLVISAMPVAALVDALTALELDQADPPAGQEVTIPVTYDGADLDDVARLTGMTTGEVIQRHSGRRYVVRCLGFAPGFPYLEGLDPKLWIPRRADPRTRVPAGSVAIAGEQTGIYPRASPGGWRLLGHTNFTLFDEHTTPPARLLPGDVVLFERTAP